METFFSAYRLEKTPITAKTTYNGAQYITLLSDFLLLCINALLVSGSKHQYCCSCTLPLTLSDLSPHEHNLETTYLETDLIPNKGRKQPQVAAMCVCVHVWKNTKTLSLNVSYDHTHTYIKLCASLSLTCRQITLGSRDTGVMKP